MRRWQGSCCAVETLCDPFLVNTLIENEIGAAELHSQDEALGKLECAWPMVMERLRSIVENDSEVNAGGFTVETVEFGISVEAGFNFVIAGTATADAKITFRRKP
ncbi:MAG: hypothetical protein AAGF79_14770 [Pseudomonadota bacterium]